MTAIGPASSSTKGGDDDAPTASETASKLKKLLKRSRQHVRNERDDAARLDELRRLFAGLIARGELILHGSATSGSSSSAASVDEGGDSSSSDNVNKNDVKARWNAFLKGRHDEFLSQLGESVRAGRKSALRTFCGVVASSPRSIGSDDGCGRMIDERLLYKLVDALTTPGDDGSGIMTTEEGMLGLFDSEFVKPHRDVQYFAMLSVKKLAAEIYDSIADAATGSSKKEKLDDKKGGSGEDAEDASGVGSSARAENLLRILLRMEIVSEDSELTNPDAFLIAPPARVAVDEEEDSDSSDDEEDDGEAVDSSSESESENESEGSDNNNVGDKRKRDSSASTASASASKRSRRSSTGKPTWQQSTKHRRILQESWLAVLKIPTLPNRALKQALQHLPTAILPIVSAPLRFADVCTRAYEVGGVTSLLALHSLFVLMMDHGLEYPKFYASLYRLVTSRNFYAKHRTRFFRLLTNCLAKSDMLPAYVVAAFCKRLARCALTAPPSGALFVLALISNLLRRHGECACLVHRGTGRGDDASLEDKFDADAQDPAQARALESSLWELAALERHCHPAVSALARSVGTENEKTPMYDMDEFLLHTYKSLFETERKRINQKKRMAVPLTFEKPKSLFTDTDIFAGLLSVPRPAGEKGSDGTN